MLLFACLYSEAQKFLRYQMNNNTYNGFYTNGIGSILHDYKNGIATTFVNAYGKVYEIPINDIDCISVEDDNIANGNVGQYRLYEFNYERGDIKKIYVDNRACLFASHNGDFGANDTIFFSSAYNDIAWVFYTDDQGRIKKFFDGNRLLFFDYESDSEFTILDLSTGTTYPNILAKRYLAKSYRASSSKISHFFRNFIQHIQHTNTQSASSALNLANNIDAVQNNPELHNQILFNDWGAIGLDIFGVIAAAGETVLTEGATATQFGLAIGSLFGDVVNLINDTWPDSQQMQRYRDYYQEKYRILVSTLPAENVSYTSASLHGHATSTEGFKGYFTFTLLGENDEMFIGEKNVVSDDWCKVSADVSNLKPGSSYFYSVHYTCVVDGLKLVFYADNIAEFMTLYSTAYTGEVQSKSSDRAEVTCQFYNFPKGAICGVEYSCNDEKAEKKGSATHEGEYYFTLAPLKPNTTYTYQAFIVIDGVYVYAEETIQFTTDIGGLCPDNNHPHMIDLGLPSGTKWACCNVGASKPEDYGGYYAWGEITEKEYYGWQNYDYYSNLNGDDIIQANELNNLNYNISKTQHDVAFVLWGESWCTPNSKELEELNNNCTKLYFYNHNGIEGTLLTGPSGNSIFLPNSGFHYWEYLQEAGRMSISMSCEIGSEDADSNPYTITIVYYCGVEETKVRHGNRMCGYTVRPISTQ